MRGIVYHGCGTTGHGPFPPTTVIASQSKVKVQGIPVVVQGDSIVTHCKPKSCHSGTVVTTSSKIKICGKPVALMADSITCGDIIAKSSSKVTGV